MTLLSIVAYLSNVLFRWSLFILLFLTLPVLFPNHLGTVPSARITIDIRVTLIFPSVHYSLAKSKYLSLFSLSLCFTLWFAGTAIFSTQQVLLLSLLIITRSGRLAEIRY